MNRAVAPEPTTGETPQRMIAAALEVFAERGFDGATTREIANRAGVNLGLIQYYFGGKDRLWKAAVDLAFSRLRAGLDAILEDPSISDDDERLRRLIRGYVRFVARNREFVLLMHDEGRRPGPRMRWLVDRHVRPLYEGMGVLLDHARGHGLVPADVDPIHLHYILAGSVGLIFHQAAECRRLTGRDPAEPDMVEAHARAVEFVLLGAPVSPEPRTGSDRESEEPRT